MSEFDGSIREFNVAVDYFHSSTFECSAFFLSHCHTDHMCGLYGPESSFTGRLEQPGVFLYCTEITSHFLTSRHTAYARLRHKIVSLQPNVPSQVQVRDAEERGDCQEVTVSAIPAGHCPGSVMFLFEGKERTVLYTGDLRVLKGDIEKFRPLHAAGRIVKNIDTLYLDTTFFNPSFWRFPAREESVRAACDVIRSWISKGPHHNICLSLPAWTGTEYLFARVANCFKMKIHVLPELFSKLRLIPEVDDAVTDDFRGTQIHAVYKANFKEIKDRVGGLFMKKIELSAARYRNTREDEVSWCREAESDNTTYICYSSHCSCSELEDVIRHLKPHKVFPCVKPYHTSKGQVKYSLQELGVPQVDLSIFSDDSDSECGVFDRDGLAGESTEVLYQKRVLAAPCVSDKKTRPPPVVEKLIDSPPPKRRQLQFKLS